MKHRPRYGNVFWALVVTAIPLFGCAGTSPSVTFYTLNALSGTNTGSPGGNVEQSIAVGVGPVAFPGYLDRPQIVTRRGQNRLNISEFHRWGDSLLKDFSRVMAKNVSILLSTNRVTVYPWPDDFSPDYQIRLDIEQFGGQLGHSATLDVRWSVTGREGKDLVIQTSAIEEPMSTADYEGLVAAMSRAIDTLSRKVTKEIHRLEMTASAQQS
jgi:uncharacterized lipoprotein YmbA